MKVTEKLAQAEREGRTYWSFEFFPPRTAQVSDISSVHCALLIIKGLQNLYDRIERMRNLGPEFIDITW
jgi:methylenetetrahydrofolate reductase (NADPH)